MEEKRGSALFLGRRLLFKNVRGVALSAAVLAVIPAAALHFDVPRQLVGGDLRLSGIDYIESNVFILMVVFPQPVTLNVGFHGGSSLVLSFFLNKAALIMYADDSTVYTATDNI